MTQMKATEECAVGTIDGIAGDGTCVNELLHAFVKHAWQKGGVTRVVRVRLVFSAISSNDNREFDRVDDGVDSVGDNGSSDLWVNRSFAKFA